MRRASRLKTSQTVCQAVGSVRAADTLLPDPARNVDGLNLLASVIAALGVVRF